MRLVAFLLAIACWNAHADVISGDVFIVTKAKGAVRLPLTKVVLYRAADMEAFVKERAEESRKVHEFMLRALRARTEDWVRFVPEVPHYSQPKDNQILGFSNYAASANWYLSGLPKSVAMTKTDADGKFAFDVPSGNYVVLSISSREIGEKTEDYTWLVRVKTGTTDLHLANDNLSDAGSQESLITAVGADDKSVLAMKGRGAEWLIAYVADRVTKAPTEEVLRAEETARKADMARVEREGKELDAKIAADRLAEEQRVERERDLANYRSDPAAAQREAIKRFPSLKVSDSPLNAEFLRRLKLYRAEKPGFFKDGAWPIILAEECAKAVPENAGK